MSVEFHRNGTRDAAKAVAAVGALTVLMACAPGGSDGESSTGGDTSGEDVSPAEPTDVATGLEVPWDYEFLPNGDALVTERDTTRIVRVTPEGDVSEVGTVDEAEPGGEGGLLGLALSPEFESDPHVYVYVTTGGDNRILRMPFEGGELGEPEVILDGIPSGSAHNGGRIAFGPDGMLYASTGDAQRSALAQDTGSLAGKILRLTPDGDVPDDNPFGNEVYSYGHRNVQGLAWDSDAQMFAVEFGADVDDEVNVIEPGGNYGWPEATGAPGDEEYIDAVVVWDPAEASPSGAAIAGGSLWVAALRGERLWRVPLTGDADDPVGEPVEHWRGEYGRLRHVEAVPDGDELWVSTSNHDGRGEPNEGDDRILGVPLR
ncbi:PQQ-dependent sugar dehydrogenase [Halostreptopolyspora alba]|uniref:PQQ-dependent sugar dehydrogenase n=1 Tax=Halostreptopolyspora alba TaxID=2487137 RepID=A0A3N0EAE2_9ACTN|nr:PQQ-dependent sugar dehydrogenase [Nocardiopsaceae bacterium YIM 96095]